MIQQIFSQRILILICVLFFYDTNAQTHANQKINPSDVTIVRDQWGIPHIYGKTDADAAYGLTWANAEDDFKSLQQPFCAIRGRAGEVLGIDGAAFDVIAFLLDLDKVVGADFYKELSPEFMKILSASAQAINDYAAANPKEVLLKKGLFPITERDIVQTYVIGSALMSNAAFDFAKIIEEELSNEFSRKMEQRGSNAWAFSKNKTQEGTTWMISNSHQPLEGFLSWYEAHVNSEEGWNMLGAKFSTGVSLFVGTNENLGWTHTVNWPDLSDIYQLTMHKDKKEHYQFDGEWLPLEKKKFKFKVKIGPLKIPISKTYYFSKYGATIKNKDGYFAVRMSATMNFKAAEQWFYMNKAQNFKEFKEALNMQGIGSLSLIYADKEDNIFFLSNGLFPERSPEYNWKGIVAGNTNETLWEADFYSLKDLPQIENPSCGYVFNMNNTPFSATCAPENVKVEDIEKTMGFRTQETNRSLRFIELMKEYEKGKISYEEFKKIKYDTQYATATFYSAGIQNMDRILELDPEQYPDIKDILAKLRNWNRSSDVDNEDAPVASLMLNYIVRELSKRVRMFEVNNIPDEMLVKALRFSKKHLKKHFGSINIPLGKLQKHVRGEVEYPMQGLPENLAAMTYEPHKKGRLKAYAGESYIQLVQYDENGVKSIESVSPYGASAHEDSPHYTDQMELFVQQKLKKMTLDKEEIFKNAKRIYHPGEK